MQKQNLFSTPTWKTHISNYEDLNHRLMAFARFAGEDHTYFETDNKAVTELKNIVTGYINDITKEYNWPRELKLKARHNVVMPKGCDTPHNHPVSALTAVYYVQLPENSGDILLHDPRGGLDCTDWSTEPRLRPFIRITPAVGDLLIFPGYLVHSVETNFGRVPRISIVMDAE